MKSKISVFGRFETVNLIFPLIFLALSFFYILSNKQQPPSQDDFFWTFLSTYIFFNGTHVAMSLLMFFLLPEFHNLTKDIWHKKRSLIYFSVFFCVYLVIVYLLKTFLTLNKVTLFILFIAPHFFWFRHTIKQNYGILSIYNFQFIQNCKDEKIKSKIISNQKNERILYGVLVAISVLNQFHNLLVKGDHRLMSRYIPFSLLALAVAAILWNTLTHSYKGLLNKTLYSFRLLLIPFTFYSTVAVAGIAASHGLESIFIYLNMIHRSQARRKKMLYSIFAVTLLIISFGVIFITKDPIMKSIFPSNSESLSVQMNTFFLMIFFTVTFLHYFLDSFIYKFSQPLIRSHMTPLILNSDKA